MAITRHFFVSTSQEPVKLRMLSGNGLSNTTSGASAGPASARRMLRPAMVRNSVGIATSGVSNDTADLRAALTFRHSGDTNKSAAALS